MEGLINKFLGFRVQGEEYAIEISNVFQVIRSMKISPIHEASEFLRGVINLRGRIIPIMDMRIKFGLPEREYDDRTVFIIVEIHSSEHAFLVGMAVDEVSDVFDLKDDQIEKTPDIGLKLRENYLTGIAQVGEKMMMILNITKILSSDEITNIQKAGSTGNEVTA
jgi:purine-binding chemotaxis protein CheW